MDLYQSYDDPRGIRKPKGNQRVRTFVARSIVALVILGLSAALWHSRTHHAAMRESVESLAEHLHTVHEEKAQLQTALHEKDRHINTKETEVAVKARELQSLEAKLGGKEHLDAAYAELQADAAACRREQAADHARVEQVMRELGEEREIVKSLEARLADSERASRERSGELERQLAEERARAGAVGAGAGAAGGAAGQQQQQQQGQAQQAQAQQAQQAQGGQQQQQGQQGQPAGEIPKPGDLGGAVPSPSPLPVPTPSPQQQQQQQQPGQGQAQAQGQATPLPSPSPSPQQQQQEQQGQRAHGGSPGPVPSPAPQAMPHHDHDPHDLHERHQRHRLSMLEEHMGMGHEDPHHDDHGRQHT